MSDQITTGNIEGVGIAIGTGASVQIYGDIHYYPITLRAPLRSVFKPLIEDRIRLFGGRGAVLKRIGAFIQESASGYLLVTAPAGFGKTALMASLVSATPGAFAYHFFTPLYGDNSLSETFFLRNVVEQMAQWHGHKGQLPDRLDELQALYQRFINESLDNTQILVLDGLDEVTRWKLAPYMSRCLPDNLHIIATVRNVGQDWMEEYGFPADQTTLLPLGGLMRTEVADVLRAAGQQAAIFADDPALLDQVMRASLYQADQTQGADPLYVRLLAEDMVAGGLTPKNIAAQPQGLNTYLNGWLRELQALAEKAEERTKAEAEAVYDLLGTLVVALGPISRADLEAMHPSLAQGSLFSPFSKALDRIRRFVAGNDQQGYALMHPRLRDYMRAHPDVNAESYLNKIITFCANWSGNQSPYARRYFLMHLSRGQQFTQLLDFLHSGGFLRLFPPRVALGPFEGYEKEIIEIISELAGDQVPTNQTQVQKDLLDIFVVQRDYYLAAQALIRPWHANPLTLLQLVNIVLHTQNVGGQLQPFWDLMQGLAFQGSPDIIAYMEELLQKPDVQEDVLYALCAMGSWSSQGLELLKQVQHLARSSTKLTVQDLCRRVLRRALDWGAIQALDLDPSLRSLVTSSDYEYYHRIGMQLLPEDRRMALEPELDKLAWFHTAIQRLNVSTFLKSISTFQAAIQRLIVFGSSWGNAYLSAVSQHSSEHELMASLLIDPVRTKRP